MSQTRHFSGIVGTELILLPRESVALSTEALIGWADGAVSTTLGLTAMLAFRLLLEIIPRTYNILLILGLP